MEIAEIKQREIWKEHKRRIKSVNLTDLERYGNYNRHHYCFVCGRKLRKRQSFVCSPECNKQLNWMLSIFKWYVIRRMVLVRDKLICQMCGRKLSIDEAEVDHIIPISRGGHPFRLENLQTLCKECHRLKTERENSNSVDDSLSGKSLYNSRKESKVVLWQLISLCSNQ